ncbi:hypothetical protein EVAR_61701_1 [Eumeta japonica]|uniref:Uncharacterized protein n=1 Tax=Eumeta variegata TaxID=151549 RepID=A0A4C1ZQV0_EUMVA|nr:hypothetical protein EVAR_61701_1 [Eumeta japonica]
MESGSPCSPGAGGVPKAQVTHALIKDIVSKALSDMGYECPEQDLNKFVRSTLLRAELRARPPLRSPANPRVLTRADPTLPPRRNKRNKRRASSSSEESNDSDCTITGSGSESESAKSANSAKSSKDDSFTLVEGKNKRAIRKALKSKSL